MQRFHCIFISCTLFLLKCCLPFKTHFRHFRINNEIRSINQAEDSFIKWTNNQNIHYEDISIRYENELRGLFAEKDFNPSDILIKVPLHKCFLGRKFDKLDLEWPIKIALELMQEEATVDSSYQPYFNMLTPKSSLQLPHQLNILQSLSNSLLEATHRICPDLIPMIESQVEWRRNALVNVKLDDIHGLNGQAGDVTTWSKYHKLSYFLDVVQTRNCRLTNDDGESMNAVVPFLDLLNHKHPSECNAEFYLSIQDQDALNEDYVIVSCKKPIKKGEEICITYGAMEAHETLVSYGFIPLSAPSDECKLLLPLLFTDPSVVQIIDTPLALLTRLNIFPDDPGYVLYRDGVGMALLVTARVLSLNTNETYSLLNELSTASDVYETSIFTQAISTANELRAVQLIHKRVRDEITNLESVSLSVADITNSDAYSKEMQWVKYLSSLREWELSVMRDTAGWLSAYSSHVLQSVSIQPAS